MESWGESANNWQEWVRTALALTRIAVSKLRMFFGEMDSYPRLTGPAEPIHVVFGRCRFGHDGAGEVVEILAQILHR